MPEFTRARTRRHLFGLAAAGAASIPFIAPAGRPALAKERENENENNDRDGGNDCKPKCCFLKGTRIATPRGEVLVEELQIGDEVCTHDGIKTIKWIGYDKFRKTAGKAWHKSVMPIRVARFAIDDHTPHRDLYLSPAHCLYLDGVLISVVHLINETSIAAPAPSTMDTIEYYHIEFDSHEVIYAEGAAVESYLGTNRENFSNFVQYERLYGSQRQSDKTPFAPMVAYCGGRDELKGLVRSLISNVVDVRDPIQVAYDRIAERAQALSV
jgi:hypothetical protein